MTPAHHITLREMRRYRVRCKMHDVFMCGGDRWQWLQRKQAYITLERQFEWQDMRHRMALHILGHYELTGELATRLANTTTMIMDLLGEAKTRGTNGPRIAQHLENLLVQCVSNHAALTEARPCVCT